MMYFFIFIFPEAWGMADVVNIPEGHQITWESSPHVVLVTFGIGLVIFGGIVHAVSLFVLFRVLSST